MYTGSALAGAFGLSPDPRQRGWAYRPTSLLAADYPMRFRFASHPPMERKPISQANKYQRTNKGAIDPLSVPAGNGKPIGCPLETSAHLPTG
jgi:hypothetical protein